MQNSVILHAGSSVCDACGESNMRVLQHEYTCMTCGMIDGGAMIVDELSEHRKQWESSESDTHVNRPARPVSTTYSSHSSDGRMLQRLNCSDTSPLDVMKKKAFTTAKRAACIFSVESDQIPSEAVCLFLATKLIGTHMSQVDVVACTMIVAHRRTAQDIEDVALVFALKTKIIATAIQKIQSCVLLGDQALGGAYGYLFKTVGDRRTNKLIEEAMNNLLEIARPAEMSALLAGCWGVRSLAEEMLSHIYECRLIGGDSLQLLARAVIVMACELLGIPVTSSDFIRSCILVNHRATWKTALSRWTGRSSFEAVVTHKRHLKEYGATGPALQCVKKQKCDTVPAAAQPSDVILRRCTRVRLHRLFASTDFSQYARTSTSSGVTHLCIFTISQNSQLQHLTQDNDQRLCDLLDVCLSAVRQTEFPTHVDRGFVRLVVETPGFCQTSTTCRRFKTPCIPNVDCFVPMTRQ